MTDITALYVSPTASETSSPLRELTEEPDIDISRTASVAETTAFLEDTVVDCVVTEYPLPDGTGVDIVAHLRDVSPDTGVILVADTSRLTGDDSPRLVAEFVPKNSPEAGTRIVQLVKSTAANRSQTAYPLPANEQARLEVLASVDLDDERLRRAVQRITDLAVAHFEMSQSSVNIIVERTQDFLACTGAAWESVPREDSACTYTMLHDGISVIEDTTSDPRFTDTEAIDEQAIRFYVSATLSTREGHPIGTLCLYDDEPHAFTEADEAFLSLLADEVMEWLDTARDNHDDATVSQGGELW